MTGYLLLYLVVALTTAAMLRERLPPWKCLAGGVIWPVAAVATFVDWLDKPWPPPPSPCPHCAGTGRAPEPTKEPA